MESADRLSGMARHSRERIHSPLILGRMNRFVRIALSLFLIAWFACGPHGLGASPDECTILPPQITLDGPLAKQKLIVQTTRQGQFRHQVHQPIAWESDDVNVVRVRDGVAVPVADGSTIIRARADGMTAQAKVEVRGMNQDPQWEFHRHVLPVLTRAGCNSGACHGALAGKGGFRLSLRGYDPQGDYLSITRAARGRRIELSDPGKSLILAKPTGALPHKGGLRLRPDSRDYHVLASWIQAGAPSNTRSDLPRLVRLSVQPRQAVLTPGDDQQLLVSATYSDGREEDVTDWAKFSSTDESVAKVDETGVVQVMGYGRGSIVVWFSSQIVLSQVTAPFDYVVEPSVYADQEKRNFIDELALQQLAELNLKPSPPVTDSEFLRRAYLDTIGTLPTPNEVRQFLHDTRHDKRDLLIESLLGRKEFVDYWTYKWSDLLLINGRRLRPRAVTAYYKWLRSHVASDTPWDQMVQEVVTASGGTEENGATNFYALHQDAESMSENVCQAFLGLSIGCAKCHNHPLEKWTNDQYYAMANLFARVKAKGWGGDARGGDGLRTLFVAPRGELIQPLTGKPQPPTPLDGDPLAFDEPGDRRVHLANWLTSPDNPYFSRSITNRVWANFFGQGLVEPVDDLRVSNPASNELLLTAASDYLVRRGFHLKALMRAILKSATYQRSSLPLPENAADRRYLSRIYPRRLPAEVLLDAIAQVTQVPTEFTQIGYDGNDFEKTSEYPLGTRAIELHDSAVVSNFLKTFGRNERDITCECERSNTPSMVQVLHINNGVTINQRLQTSANCVTQAVQQQLDESIERAYLATLCRYPTDGELRQLQEVFADSRDVPRRELLEDLYWSLMSSREFLFNH